MRRFRKNRQKKRVTNKSRRRFVKQVAAAGVAAAVAGALGPLARADHSPWFAAYPYEVSVRRGGLLKFGLRTPSDHATLYLHIYRQGSGSEPTYVTTCEITNPAPYRSVSYGPANAAGVDWEDWEWPSFEIQTASGWEPGVYFAWFTDGPATPLPANVYSSGTITGFTIFVVMRTAAEVAASPRRILYKIPTNTYHAYNIGTISGDSLNNFYNVKSKLETPSWHDFGNGVKGFRITLRRPGGGAGAASTPAGKEIDGTTDVRNNFGRGEAPMVRWLEAQGLGGDVDYCTDSEIHNSTYGTTELRKHRVLLTSGHDEYWSETMRTHIRTFLQNGGHVACFSGDTCFMRVHFVGSHQLVCNVRTAASGAPEDAWWNVSLSNSSNNVDRTPENALLGVSTRNGCLLLGTTGYGYKIQNSLSWLCHDTGLSNGSIIGGATAAPIVHYEVDGPYCHIESDGQVRLASDAPSLEQAPANLRIIGFKALPFSDIPRESGKLPTTNDQTMADGSAAARYATMCYHTNIGTVFASGTTDWVFGLGEANVSKVTSNVLRGLSARSKVLGVQRYEPSGVSALLCSNPHNKAVSVWFLDSNGNAPTLTEYVDRIPTGGWELIGSGSLASGTAPDLVFFNPTTREAAVWHMAYSASAGLKLSILQVALFRNSSNVTETAGIGWAPVSTADLDGNGRDEVLFFNSSTREVGKWTIGTDGVTVTSKHQFANAAPSGYRLVGAADMNSNGVKELVFFNDSTGAIGYAGTDSANQLTLLDDTADLPWKLVGIRPVSGARPSLYFQNASTSASAEGEVAVWPNCSRTNVYLVTPHP